MTFNLLQTIFMSVRLRPDLFGEMEKPFRSNGRSLTSYCTRTKSTILKVLKVTQSTKQNQRCHVIEEAEVSALLSMRTPPAGKKVEHFARCLLG